ncbi:hypothetical protein HII28_08560 [Planctomonas sp. JC2975]|uniref:IniB N-terminal domain-containing protein n=1 Tax=Planctomonas sp. JC2975 TaxID=2729626 RepID=UPI001474467E|nr:IniB N-terminal domain-containing protein [Planctomonas sp. JC2975]NNC11930.1 hypothetical protein [Planctomonas sp. JC2975]
MSVTLATVADSLIDFILSLLQDPAATEKFNSDPQTVLADNGLSGISAADVCAVAPVIAERPGVQVLQMSPHFTVSDPPSDPPSRAVQEIQTITHNLTYVDNRSTLVDQSTNQNIWATGDVTQNFDQHATVGSGDGSTVAGGNIDLTSTQDDSTHITGGGDVNIGNTTTQTTSTDSGNTLTDNSAATDNSTNVDADDALNSTAATTTTDDSHNSSAADYNDTHTTTDDTFPVRLARCGHRR